MCQDTCMWYCLWVSEGPRSGLRTERTPVFRDRTRPPGTRTLPPLDPAHCPSRSPHPIFWTRTLLISKPIAHYGSSRRFGYIRYTGNYRWCLFNMSLVCGVPFVRITNIEKRKQVVHLTNRFLVIQKKRLWFSYGTSFNFPSMGCFLWLLWLFQPTFWFLRKPSKCPIWQLWGKKSTEWAIFFWS